MNKVIKLHQNAMVSHGLHRSSLVPSGMADDDPPGVEKTMNAGRPICEPCPLYSGNHLVGGNWLP